MIHDRSGWEHFAGLMANELSLALPDDIPGEPDLMISDIVEGGPDDPMPNFLADFIRMVRESDIQTESSAEHLLELVLKGYAVMAKEKGVRINIDAFWALGLPIRAKLGCFLSTIEDETIVKQILNFFPALIDQELVDELNTMVEETHDKDEDLCRRYVRLQGIVEDLLIKD